MRLSKELEEYLVGLGVKSIGDIDLTKKESDSVIKKQSESATKKAPKIETIEKEEIKNIYTVYNLGTKFALESDECGEMLLFRDDTIELIGDDYKYVNGNLYRKVRIIKSWFSKFNGRTGWIEVSGTDAPRHVVVKKEKLGQLELTQEDIVIRDTKDLSVIGSLNKGDTVDFDEFSDFIALEESILRKVIIRECDNPDLLNKKVWMPILLINKEDSVGMYNTEFTVTKDSVELDINFDDETVYQLSVGDTFILTEGSVQLANDRFYKEVKVLTSSNESLIGVTGWIEIRHSDAFISTIDLVSNGRIKSYKDARVVLCKEFVLPRSCLVFKPHSNILDDSVFIRLEEGTVVTVFDEYDCNNCIVIQLKQTNSDGSIDLVEYAMIKDIYFKAC